MNIHKTAQEIRLEPEGPVTASIIWLHGLGADGGDFVPLVPQLQLPNQHGLRFIFPHAPVRKVTINNGYPMRAWYDITSLSAERQDEAGIRESQARIAQLISSEQTAGIPAERILLAGFSQGGAMALHTGLRYPEPLAGIVGLSTYLPLHHHLMQEGHPANRATPIFLAHGRRDGVLPYPLGELSAETLRALGHAVEWHAYDMAHEVCAPEIEDLRLWIHQRLQL